MAKTSSNDWRELPKTNLKMFPHEPETQPQANSRERGWLLNIKGFLDRFCEELRKHLSGKNTHWLSWAIKILSLLFVISICILYFLVSIGDQASAFRTEKLSESGSLFEPSVEKSKRLQQQAILLKILQQAVPRFLPLEEGGKAIINETHQQ